MNEVKLSRKERQELEKLVSQGNHSSRVINRARLFLLKDLNHNQPRYQRKELKQILGLAEVSISVLCRRFVQEGLQRALYDKPRSGQPLKLNGSQEAQLTALACSDAPEGHERWTLRMLAEKSVELGIVESISHVAVRDYLKKTNLSLGKSEAGA